MPVKLSDLVWPEDPENMGGLQSIGYICKVSDIDVFPAVPENTADKAALLVGDYTLKVPTAGFVEIYSTPGKTGFTAESQGDVDCKSVHPVGQFFYPTLSDEARSFARKINNAQVVVIFFDGESDNKRIVLGTKGRPALCSIAGDSGKAAADAKGITFNLECDSFVPGWTYNGAIPLQNGTTIPAVTP